MAVAYSSIGAGQVLTGGFNPSLSTSFAHTVVANTMMVIVTMGRCGAQTGVGQTTATCTVTGGTVTKRAQLNVPTEQYLIVWTCPLTTAGSKTVACTVGNGANTGRSMITQSFGYTGVVAVGAGTTATGTSTLAAVDVQSGGTANDLAFNTTGQGGSATVAGPNFTQRHSASDGAGFAWVLSGDGLPSIGTFTDTLSVSSGWTSFNLLLAAAAIPSALSNQFFAMF